MKTEKKFTCGMFYLSQISYGNLGNGIKDDHGWRLIIRPNLRTVVLPKKTGTHLIHCRVEETESLRSHGQEFKEIKLEASSIVPVDIGSATQLHHFKWIKMLSKQQLRSTMNTSALLASVQPKGEFWDRLGLRFFLMEPYQNSFLSISTLLKIQMQVLATHFGTDKVSASPDSASERVVYGSTVPVRDVEELTMRILASITQMIYNVSRLVGRKQHLLRNLLKKEKPNPLDTFRFTLAVSKKVAYGGINGTCYKTTTSRHSRTDGVISKQVCNAKWIPRFLWKTVFYVELIFRSMCHKIAFNSTYVADILLSMVIISHLPKARAKHYNNSHNKIQDKCITANANTNISSTS
ncbi:1,2-beta-fructan 1F-fructosyltransferase [Artemisia annua]|uniref:1,2-beta-fructan 1F-fructosyltransferase n=1 Tax=Artemisia annua TaxID=35608 RepID=A0A2U1M1M1_ARTAN|nr:1,2-beta-fructan 1F-fructosyltransferase [Artemisia annua]